MNGTVCEIDELLGMTDREVDVVAEGNKALIVKSRRENMFMKWLGRGERKSKMEADQMVDEIRGRSDEQKRVTSDKGYYST